MSYFDAVNERSKRAAGTDEKAESVNIKKISIHFPHELDFRTSEAYKTLRTNIDFCGADVKVIAITSCTPNEGKSTVSLNLAVSLAQSGKNVLFIDADMRKSVMKTRYRIDELGSGLSHLLAGRREILDCLYETDIRSLNVIPTGPVPPNPSELLGTKRFKNLINKVKGVYDYVIMDTPPLGSVIDAAVVAKECDGIALVIEAGAIGRKFAERVLEQIKMADCKVLGVILNKVEVGSKYYGKYYGSYYGKYYGK